MWKRGWTYCGGRRNRITGSPETAAMSLLKTETAPVHTDTDVVLVRQQVRAWAVELGFGLVDQTKIVTAASELARNVLIYGEGGTVRLDALNDGMRKGLRLTFEDHGPGITDLQLA